jgi:aspartyl-tRNA synthetase
MVEPTTETNVKEETTAASTEAPATDKTPEQIEAEKEAKKLAKEKAKAENKAAREQKKLDRLKARQEADAKKNEFVKDPNDPCADKFGEMDLNRSQCDPELRFTRKYVAVKDLSAEHKDQDVRIRGRLHNSRAKGKMCFVVVREGFATA